MEIQNIFEPKIIDYLGFGHEDVKSPLLHFSIKEMIDLSKEFKFYVNNPRSEFAFIEMFLHEFPKFPICPTWIYGTVNLFALTRKDILVFFDHYVVDNVFKNSTDVSMIIGALRSKERAEKKLDLFQIMYPFKECVTEVIQPWTIYERIKSYPKDQLLKIVLKMSGEYSHYTDMLYHLYEVDKYRNLIVIMMKGTGFHGQNFRYAEMDFREPEEKFRLKQIPDIPLKSPEHGRDERRQCPKCLIGRAWTVYYKDSIEGGYHHKCTQCYHLW